MAIEIPGVGPIASDAIIKKINEGGVLQEDLVSGGEALTIAAGATVWEAIQAIMDLVDPSGG